MGKNKKNLLQREEDNARRLRATYAERYPFVFALSTAFGLVSTFYGFEKLIDKVDLFVDNPWILLATGLFMLAITGSLYNKLK